jgi:putative pyruvate formate lyase activating enzyme
VTGSHAVPAIALALRRARELGLSVPALWNSSAYESPGTLSLLDGLVTVWLPDLKTLNPNVARAAFKAEDYPRPRSAAIRSMVDGSPLEIERPERRAIPLGTHRFRRHRQAPRPAWATRRHRGGLALVSGPLGRQGDPSLMTQYTPVAASPHARELTAFENRPISVDEYGRLTELIEKLGVDTGFTKSSSREPIGFPISRSGNRSRQRSPGRYGIGPDEGR